MYCRTMQDHTYVIFGIAGSGKGTQMELLKKFIEERDKRETVYVYPGGEYRKLLSADTYTSNLVRESMNKGHLQPNFLTNAIVTDILKNSFTPEKNLIIDGYPRTVNQSETFEEMMKFYQRDNIKIIYIEVGKEEAMRRNLARARADDTKEGIEKRFDEYVNNVVPAMNYFVSKSDYEIFKINGEQTIEEVHRDIIAALKL